MEGGQTPQRPGRIDLRFRSGFVEVREALVAIKTALSDAAVTDDQAGLVELTLAEALNNVVEHAYPQDAPGWIGLSLGLQPDRLSVEIRDRGRPLPDECLPDRGLPDIDVAREDLPEGGFGRFLVESLTDTLEYSRVAGENRLTLSFVLSAAGGP